MSSLKGLKGTVVGFVNEDLRESITIDSGGVVAEDVLGDRHFVIVENLNEPAVDAHYRFERSVLWGAVKGSKVILVTTVTRPPKKRLFDVEEGSTPRIQGLADTLRLRLAENGDIDVSGLCNADVIRLAEAEQLI